MCVGFKWLFQGTGESCLEVETNILAPPCPFYTFYDLRLSKQQDQLKQLLLDLEESVYDQLTNLAKFAEALTLIWPFSSNLAFFSYLAFSLKLGLFTFGHLDLT